MALDRAKLKELLLQSLIEKGEYAKASDALAGDDSEGSAEKSEALLKTLVDKGDVGGALRFLKKDDKVKETKESRSTQRALSMFADTLTSNTRGVFMKDLMERVDGYATQTSQQLTKDFTKAEKALGRDLTRLLNEEKKENKQELLAVLERSSQTLRGASERLIRELVSKKADEMLADLGEQARLTDDEKEELVLDASLAVESQMPNLISEYFKNANLSTDQIDGLRELVQELIPEIDFTQAEIDWKQLRNVPNFSSGGAIHSIAFLRDVHVDGITNGQTLIWNSTAKRFEAGGGGFSTEISSATPTINTDKVKAHSITALAVDVTSMSTNLSGTPTNFKKLIVRFKDDGTSRSIAWGARFEARGIALPTATTISKVLTVGFIYDSVTSKWGCVAKTLET